MPREHCPAETNQPTGLGELFTTYCLKLPSFVEFSYTAINNRNNHSFQEAGDGIKNIINKWILPTLMILKVICCFIDISFYNINILVGFHIIQGTVFKATPLLWVYNVL